MTALALEEAASRCAPLPSGESSISSTNLQGTHGIKSHSLGRAHKTLIACSAALAAKAASALGREGGSSHLDATRFSRATACFHPSSLFQALLELGPAYVNTSRVGSYVTGAPRHKHALHCARFARPRGKGRNAVGAGSDHNRTPGSRSSSTSRPSCATVRSFPLRSNPPRRPNRKGLPHTQQTAACALAVLSTFLGNTFWFLCDHIPLQVFRDWRTIKLIEPLTRLIASIFGGDVLLDALLAASSITRKQF